jgi:hypothetical protein
MMAARTILSTVLISAGLCSTAQASGDLYCATVDESVTVHIGLGRVPVFAPLGGRIETPDATWSTEDQTIGSISGFYDDDDSIRVDFTDETVAEIIARLRVFQAYEAESYAMAGILQIVGKGSYAVICDGG